MLNELELRSLNKDHYIRGMEIQELPRLFLFQPLNGKNGQKKECIALYTCLIDKETDIFESRGD